MAALVVVFFQQITYSYAFALGIFSIANIVQSIAEVPTSVVSDRIGRRKTMILSSMLTMLAYIMFALSGTFFHKYLMVFWAVIWAVADAFASVTDDALMYETME